MWRVQCRTAVCLRPPGAALRTCPTVCEHWCGGSHCSSFPPAHECHRFLSPAPVQWCRQLLPGGGTQGECVLQAPRPQPSCHVLFPTKGVPMRSAGKASRVCPAASAAPFPPLSLPFTECEPSPLCPACGCSQRPACAGSWPSGQGETPQTLLVLLAHFCVVNTPIMATFKLPRT